MHVCVYLCTYVPMYVCSLRIRHNRTVKKPNHNTDRYLVVLITVMNT